MKILLTTLLLFAQIVFAHTYPQHFFVLDVGSSGTRGHVYRILTAEHPGDLPRIQELASQEQDKTKTALDSYSDNPELAAQSLEHVFESARQKISADQGDPAKTPTYLFATAGMRLLSQHDPAKEQAIYHSIQHRYQKQFDFRRLETISGEWEGAYIWLGVNYLLNTLKEPVKTVGVIEMGGSSLEVTFLDSGSCNANSEAALHLTVGQLQYDLYSKTYLGLGQDQAELAVKPASYCYPEGSSENMTGSFSYEACHQSTEALIQRTQVASSINQCLSRQHLVGTSALYYVASFFKTDESAKPLAALQAQVKSICNLPYSQLANRYPNISEKYLTRYCLNATYHLSLLESGLGLNPAIEAANFHYLNEVATQDGLVSASWALGAALYWAYH